MAARFTFLTGDVNWPQYGGKFVRKVGTRRYHIMEVMNWRDACGREAPAETYNVSLSEVDLDVIPENAIVSALRSWGWDRNGDTESGDHVILTDLILVEVLHSCGSKAPLGEYNGNNLRKLMQSARAESAALDNRYAHKAAMAKPVNAIGSTADEFMRGDIVSAMSRGDTTAHKIMRKMHGIDY